MKQLITAFISSVFCTFSLAQVPSISGFAPQSGAIGSTVTITGTNFNSTAANNIVYFGSVKASVTSATTTSLTVTVPTGAGYEPIYITVNGLIGFSSKPFSVVYPSGGMDFTASSFAAKSDFSGGGSAIDADWDGDGKIDLAYSIFAENRVFFWRNTTTGADLTFPNFPSFFGGLVNVIGLARADFDGDGKTDIVAATPTSNAVYVFRNESSGAGSIWFPWSFGFGTGAGPRKVTVADINGDGKIDIISSNQSGNTISVLRNTCTGTTISFAAKVDFTVAATPEDITAGDLDGDGKPDIAVSCSDADVVSVLRNTSTVSTISFAAKTDIITQDYPWGVAIGDIDGDGKPDIAASNLTTNSISVFKNNSTAGALSFSAATNFTTANSPRGIKIGDLNADGKPEIAAACYFSSSLLSILKNTSTSGTISFNAYTSYATNTGANTVVMADMNGDMLTDVVTGNSASSSSGTLSYFKNQLNINPLSSVSSRVDVSEQLSIYPNPSSSWAFIKHPSVNKKGVQLIITDVSGKQVLKSEVKTQTIQSILNISQLQTGVYFITWNNGNERGSVKFQKN
jgi:FG-GAP-like repeat/Secretion system C-terminal sorting domain/IPT/TIG domain